ncbi:hypothetical protein Pcinc_043821 [Petrolisthes cinctipes]|uniref:Uncharacterized protein n=1 Tax=Petrolisthes cinctipes TaxID=88211 RepID=A0AAE1BIG1_PETCI|nr:hypothetical protein Pcinc_043821 [Petrolisthes cinctipes]
MTLYILYTHDPACTPMTLHTLYNHDPACTPMTLPVHHQSPCTQNSPQDTVSITPFNAQNYRGHAGFNWCLQNRRQLSLPSRSRSGLPYWTLRHGIQLQAKFPLAARVSFALMAYQSSGI